MRRDALAGRDLQLAGAGPQRRDRRKQGGPGNATLPAMTRTRPRWSLSPSSAGCGSGIRRRNSRVIAPSLIAPRPWRRARTSRARRPPRAARRSCSGAASAAPAAVAGVEAVLGDRAVRDIAFGVDRQDLLLRHGLEKIAQAEHDDLVADDQHAAAAVVQGDRVERAAQAQDDVAPALAAGRPVVELAEEAAELGLVGMMPLDAGAGEPVEDAELLLAQALVDDERVALGAEPACRLDELGRALRPQIGRGQDDVRPFRGRQRGEPASERARLLFPERRSTARRRPGRRCRSGRGRPRARRRARRCRRSRRDGRSRGAPAIVASVGIPASGSVS